MMVLRAHVHSHVPCRGEVDFEAVPLRDQLLPIGVLMMRSPTTPEVLAQAIEQPSRPTLIS
jgi:hypothetical protein